MYGCWLPVVNDNEHDRRMANGGPHGSGHHLFGLFQLPRTLTPNKANAGVIVLVAILLCTQHYITTTTLKAW